MLAQTVAMNLASNKLHLNDYKKSAKEIAIELSVPQLPKVPLSYLLLLPDLGGKSDETNRSKSIQT